MTTKLTPWQNGIICETLAFLARDQASPAQLTEARRALVSEFEEITARTDFRIDTEKLEQFKKEIIGELVEKLQRQGLI